MVLNGFIIPSYILIYSTLAGGASTYLLIYHTYLIVSNLTTKEEMKGTFDNLLGNPFKRYGKH